VINVSRRSDQPHVSAPQSASTASARQVGSGTVTLVIAMMVVNGVNFGINIWLASVLAPGTFGDISLMVTLLLIVGVLASVLQLTTSVAVLDPFRDTRRDLEAMRLLTNRVGMGSALVLALATPQLTQVLRVGSPWALLVMAFGLPLHLQLAVERGRLHGEMAFGKLTRTLLAEGGGRAGATVVAVLLADTLLGLTVALNVGFLTSYLVCRPRRGAWSWCDMSSPLGHPPLRSVGVGLIAVTLLINVDLFVAKVLFDPVVAGGFAALTLAGRIVFFGSWTIQQVVLPFVTADDAPFTETLRRRAFTAVNLVVASVLAGIAWVTADLWVEITYDSTFADLASLVGPYALGTGLIAIVAGVAMLASVSGNSRPALVLLGGVIALGLALFLAGGSLEAFVAARTAVVVVLVVLAWGVSIYGNRGTKRNRESRRLNVGDQPI